MWNLPTIRFLVFQILATEIYVKKVSFFCSQALCPKVYIYLLYTERMSKCRKKQVQYIVVVYTLVWMTLNF